MLPNFSVNCDVLEPGRCRSGSSASVGRFSSASLMFVSFSTRRTLTDGGKNIYYLGNRFPERRCLASPDAASTTVASTVHITAGDQKRPSRVRVLFAPRPPSGVCVGGAGRREADGAADEQGAGGGGVSLPRV